MKAYVLHGIGDLRYEDVPVPEIKAGWALVRVAAAGVCSSDIPRIFTKGTYRFPTIPGHEFCGVVEDVAEEKDRAWIGKRVGVFPLIPCKGCPSCAKGQYETCSHYDYIGSRRDGAFAEFTAVPVWNLLELPEAVSNIQGALLEPAAVALHAVKRANIQSGESVCVVGTGPIGLLAGQWAALMGAVRVCVMGRSDGKRQLVQKCGLEYLSGETEERFDCVIEAVGTNNALLTSLKLAAPGGKIVLMGNPDGDRHLDQNLYWSILRKQLTLNGSWNSSYGGLGSDWAGVVEAIRTGTLQTGAVVSHVFGMDEALRALALMRDKREPYCKVVMISNEI